MFSSSNYNIIAAQEHKYISFPDVIQSKKNVDHFFVVFRESNGHHPTQSKVHLVKSEDKGTTWELIYTHEVTMNDQHYVWNCPRLSYLPDDSLNIFCDVKTSRYERAAKFVVLRMISFNEGVNFTPPMETEIIGMVPDRIIPFKNKLFCANHRTNLLNSNLFQYVNVSKDNGNTWRDNYCISTDRKHKFCEASLVNMNNEYLIAYLRDNSVKPKPVYTYTSVDGKKWENKTKLSIYGHRVVVIKDEDKIIGTFRNTANCALSIFAQKDNKIVDVYDIDQEKRSNMYNFGYSGIVKYSKNTYLVVYYIQQDKESPFIKSCLVNYF